MRMYIFAGSLCKELEMDLEAGSVSAERVGTTIKRGLKIEKVQEPLEATKYVISCFKRLVCGYERTKMAEDINKIWQEVLAMIEEKELRVVKVDDEKLAFTLYCPTPVLSRQLYDRNWIEKLTEQLQNLIEILGIILYITLLTNT